MSIDKQNWVCYNQIAVTVEKTKYYYLWFYNNDTQTGPWKLNSANEKNQKRNSFEAVD